MAASTAASAHSALLRSAIALPPPVEAIPREPNKELVDLVRAPDTLPESMRPTLSNCSHRKHCVMQSCVPRTGLGALAARPQSVSNDCKAPSFALLSGTPSARGGQ